MPMTRRSFVASIAVALLAPRIRLRPEIDREALMLPFCGESPRWDFDAPFGVGSLTYATDAFRLVRAELPARRDDGERRIPDVSAAWRVLWHPDRFVPFARPDISDLRYRSDYGGTCPDCCGRRVFLGDTYPTYEEINDRYAKLQYDVDDNSIGDVTCRTCRGRDYDGPHLVRVGDSFFDYGRLKPVWDLPNVSVSLGANCAHLDSRPLLFSADGFEGVVCPLAQEFVTEVAR
jgi:hypothetical protein